ncbi:unnamed protein product [Arabis nemorensis]|uniref:Uncharacterized protein n=1 Tax=Arabis nemorensis TaxID=586526 RepID=A0A565AJS1_9BRAS|nr:unnamed protein product [Arabis nemorensis]
MEKSTFTATQIAEQPPPSSATSSLPAQDLPPPVASDQRSSPAMVAAELPSVAMDLDKSPAFNPEAAVQGQTFPTPAAAAQPAQVPAPPSGATTDPSSRGRKRPLEGNLKIENSNYYKMRLLLKDLRPHVVEVLRTPDFRKCNAAIEIQEKMKLMLELYREMIGESPNKREKTAKTESLSNGKAIDQTSQSTTTGLRSSETSYVQTEKQNSNGDGDTVVGGSAFGWNFVTHGGKEAVYCGMSKEEYRSSHPITPMEAEVELHNTL